MSCYYSLMSQDAYGSFNRKLANLTTLETAVYWAEILDIIPHVIKKNTSDTNGFFKLDRDYIKDRTCIQLEDQLNLDSILASMGVLERDVDNSDLIRVNLEKMAALLVDTEIKKLDLPKTKTKVSRTQAAQNKQAAVVSTMKRLIQETDTDLRNKYESWVDSVYASKRFLTKVKINTFELAINTFSADKQVKLDLLDIAIQTGYDVADWVIHKYTVNKQNTPVTLAPQKTMTSVSKNFEF